MIMNELKITFEKLRLVLKEQKEAIHIALQEEENQKHIEDLEEELIELQINKIRQDQKFNMIRKQRDVSTDRINHLKSIIKETEDKQKLKESINDLEEYLNA